MPYNGSPVSHTVVVSLRCGPTAIIFLFSTSTFTCCIIDLFHDVLRGHSSDDDEQSSVPECDKVNNWRVLSIFDEE